MKKAFILLGSIVLVFGTTGLAIAIPFSDTINFDRYNLIGDTIPGIFDCPYDKWASQIIQLDESLLSGVSSISRTIGFNLKENDFIRLYKSILNGEYTTMRDVEYTAARNPVPEPATMFLFGTGMIYLAGVNRKRILKKIRAKKCKHTIEKNGSATVPELLLSHYKQSFLTAGVNKI